MKNILSSITQEEKNSILEMHRRATSKHYLTEQPTPETTPTPTGQAVGGGSNVSAGSTLSNGIKIASEPTTDTRRPGIVFIPKEDGTGNEFHCEWHEKGKYLLWPTANGKHTLTQEESQALYNKFCKSGSNTETTGQAVGGGMKVDVGTTLANGMNIKKFNTSALDRQKIVFVQTEDSGMGQNFGCANHEQGKYKLAPKGELTQAESQALYDKFCKK